MRFTNAVLFICAAVLGLIARTVLADGHTDACPTTIRFRPDNSSETLCPTACIAAGKSGTCIPVTSEELQIPLYHYDSAQGKWVKNSAGSGQPEVYTGPVERCECNVNEGTPEDPNYQCHGNPCCVIYRVPALDFNSVHTIGKRGSCSGTGCPGGECKAEGTNVVVTAVCE